MAVLTLDDHVVDEVVSADWRARWAIAALSAAAAVVHVAMAPPHLGDSAVLGGGFVAAAWLQLGVAVFAITRPTARLWQATILLNVALVAAWAVSRTAGLPFGSHAGDAEAMTIVDLTTVGLELAALLGAVTMLAVRPTGGRLLFPIVSVLAVATASVAVASPDAREHGHGAGVDDHHGVAATPEHERLVELGFGEFMNGHAHGHVEVVLDPTSQAALDAQLAVTREAADLYPTVQDALDAGYSPAGPYVPGLGYHLINFQTADHLNTDGVFTDAELRTPLGLMYQGADPTSELGGFMYYAATDVEPTGFVGRNDGWHFHENLCGVWEGTKLTLPFGPDFGATKAQCDGIGGTLMDSQWMVHVWTVPGWDDMTDHGGVFAEMHPRFACSDGTFHMVEFEDWGDWNNVCVTRAAGEPDVDL
ncbi:MAG TPA: hypothetical protein VEA78_00420 [Acidimicrobiales bacterium]|nr:hypothetical protein [Acidimicrobiales bacterium]